jgi:hypothetical protein
VYCVIRTSVEAPEFREISPAGHFKGSDPTVTVAELEALWVPGAVVVYIGRANHGADERRGLRKRLDEFRNFGDGRPVGHSGGKRIWQLQDSAQLLVAWKVTEDIEVKRIERHLIETFLQQYGRLPFANMY